MTRRANEQTNRPESVWDYAGLVAECFDLWFGDEPFPDQAYYARRISEGRGPALELGSGTGRLLLPYLREGLPVEGLEPSAEMLAICRGKAAREGLRPVLHEQTMQALDLPKRYATIYVPQCSFQILSRAGEGLEALERFAHHLEHGGRLFVSLALPRLDPDAEPTWTLRRHGRLERDGTLVSVFSRSRFDCVEQLLFTDLRYETERDGRTEVALTQSLRERCYTPPEFGLLLEQAGFSNIEIHGDHTDERAGPQHHVAVFGATRGGPKR